MHKPESIQANETHKILWDFDFFNLTHPPLSWTYLNIFLF